jgi:hypothetical protein
MKGIILGGAILILLGLLALAVPVFTTEQTKDVAKLGDLKVQTHEQQSHVIPPLLSGGVLALGVVLLGVGVLKR